MSWRCKGRHITEVTSSYNVSEVKHLQVISGIMQGDVYMYLDFGFLLLNTESLIFIQVLLVLDQG